MQSPSGPKVYPKSMEWQIALVPGSITKARDDEDGSNLSDDAGKQVRIEVNLPQHASTEEEDDDGAEEDSARCSPSSGGNAPRHRNGIVWRCMSKFCVALWPARGHLKLTHRRSYG